MAETAVASEARTKVWRVAGKVLGAGFLGMMVFLAANTASNMMQNCGSANFASWIGAKLHEKVIQFGDKRGQKAYAGPEGEDNWTMVAPHLKLKYYLGPGLLAGFLLGAAVGGGLAAWEWRRRALAAASGGAQSEGAVAKPEGLILPAHWPLMIALVGTLFHGYLLGLAAIVLVGRTRARPWLAWLTRIVGAGVVLFWGVGTEMWWGPGWSTTYRGLANILKIFFAGIGME